MRLLAARGQLATWLQPGQRHLLVVRRVDRWVSDSDSGTFTEQQRAADPFKEFVDEAWRAFRSDVGYAVAIAEAAARLARLEHRDPGAFDRFDTDTAHGGEGGPPQVSPLGSR
jgi:hypothetical protein